MKQGVEGGHEEIPSRHPLAALSLGALLTVVSDRVRRGTRVAGRDARPVAEQPLVADRTGIRSLLTAEAVGQVGNMLSMCRAHDRSLLGRRRPS
jgi:hypothetical protein